MLTCRDVTEKTSSYVDGELSLVSRLGMRLHLAMCQHCRLFVRQFEAGLKMLGKIRQPEASEDQVQEIMRRVKEAENDTDRKG